MLSENRFTFHQLSFNFSHTLFWSFDILTLLILALGFSELFVHASCCNFSRAGKWDYI